MEVSIDDSQCTIDFFGQAKLVEQAISRVKAVADEITEKDRRLKDISTETFAIQPNYITYLTLDAEFLKVSWSYKSFTLFHFIFAVRISGPFDQAHHLHIEI